MRLKIKHKLIGSFISVSLLFGIAAGFSYWSATSTQQSYDYIVHTASELRSLTQDIQTDSAVQISNYRAYMLYEDPKFKTLLYDANDRIDQDLVKAIAIADHKEVTDRLEEIRVLNQEFKQLTVRVMNAYYVNKKKAIAEGITTILPISDQISTMSNTMVDWLQQEIIDKKIIESERTAQTAVLNSALVGCLAVLVALGLGFFISQLLAVPIVGLGAAARRMASGDFTAEKLSLRTKDELHELNESFEEMKISLREMIQGIAASSDQLAASADQLTTGAQQSGKAAEAVASSIQEMAGGAEVTTVRLEGNTAALQEVLQGVRLISSSTEEVLGLSRQATEEAR